MLELFYTDSQKEKLKKISEDASAKHKPLSEAMGAAILDALGEQQNTMLAILEEMKDRPKTNNYASATAMRKGSINEFMGFLNEEALGEIERALRGRFGQEPNMGQNEGADK